MSIVNNEKAKPVTCLVSCLLGMDDSHSQFLADTITSLGYPLQLICPGEIPTTLIERNIRQYRLPLPTHNFEYGSSLLNLCAGLWQRLRNSVTAYKQLIRIRPGVVFCIQPDSWLIATLAKKRLHNKVIEDLREIYEDRAAAFPGFLNPLVRRIVRSSLLAMAQSTDEIIHVNKARQQFYGYLGKPGKVISVFPSLKEMTKHESVNDGKIDIVHAGGLRWSYASEEFLEAIPIVLKQEPKARFIVIGAARSKLKNISLMKELEDSGDLVLINHIPHDEVMRKLRKCDIGLSLVLPIDQTHILAMPRKLFEYLAAGIPVVASDVPPLREIVAENECGVLVDARSPENIAQGILSLCEDPILRRKLGSNGQQSARQIFNAESEKAKIESLLDQLTAS
jgi:glycosyltransferase involved in cell wall biosynthesis